MAGMYVEEPAIKQKCWPGDQELTTMAKTPQLITLWGSLVSS